MTESTKKRIRDAMEADLGRAEDNAHRSAAQCRRACTAGDLALDALYRRELAEARAALLEFDPNWTPRRAFSSR